MREKGFDGRKETAEEALLSEQAAKLSPAGEGPVEEAPPAGSGEANPASGPAGAGEASQAGAAAEAGQSGAETALPGQAPEESAAAPDQKPWEQEIEALKALLQQKHEELLRKQADFDNYRRISRNEREEMREYALSDFFKKLLPVLDNMERALVSARQGNVPGSYVEGLEMIQKQLLTLLEQEGVTAIECLGQPFDPNFHHAVLHEEGEGEADLVVAELQRGYMHKKRLLRPSMVKVSRG